MLTRAQKEELVAELAEKFGRATSVYVADYRGLDVGAVNELRRRIRSEGKGDFEYRVTKNSLALRACGETQAAAIAEHIEGPTALALSYGDPLALAKVLAGFAKEHEVFELKGGVFEGQALDRAEIAKLATLPSLDALRSQLIALLQAPATKLARLLTEPAAQLARLVEARRAQQDAEGAS